MNLIFSSFIIACFWSELICMYDYNRNLWLSHGSDLFFAILLFISLIWRIHYCSKKRDIILNLISCWNLFNNYIWSLKLLTYNLKYIFVRRVETNFGALRVELCFHVAYSSAGTDRLTGRAERGGPLADPGITPLLLVHPPGTYCKPPLPISFGPILSVMMWHLRYLSIESISCKRRFYFIPGYIISIRLNYC